MTIQHIRNRPWGCQKTLRSTMLAAQTQTTKN